jgi:serine phosphatase RsbU (regulator of sigma subunit)
MTKEDSSGLSKRLADFAARFEERRKSSAQTIPVGGRSRVGNTVLQDLRELFTRDITRAGLRDLVKRDSHETYRFYTSNIDFESFKSLPRYQRYPTAAWKIFVALAHRLSPPRRIAFVIGIFLGIIGWIELISFRAQYSGDNRSSGMVWLIVSAAVLLMLLLMELRDKLDLKGDLEIAREIQFGLVPTEPYHSNGTSIYSYMRPANTVGGDYFDILKLENNVIGVVIGDVSGKGMPAALLMALLQGSLRTLSTAGLRGSELITKLNRYLCANIPANRLITLFYGELDTATGVLRYVNAGHNAPFLMRRGQDLERLPSTSLVLGVNANTCYEAMEARVCPGESLLLFTDGITEAFNARDEEYGEERLASFLKRSENLPPTELIKGVVDEVMKFCGSIWPKDDMTLMSVLRREP